MRPEWRRRIVLAYLYRLAISNKPILIGPWRSELGFEALYWLPFLRWASRMAHLDPKRFVIVTRGGAGVLYGATSLDLYQLRSIETVRRENLYDWTKFKVQKQLVCTPWDRDVLKEAARQVLGHEASYHVLHPNWMYWALEPFWEEYRGMQHLFSLTDYSFIPKPPVASVELPDKYVALKWYDRATFPRQQEAVQQAVAQITSIVGAQTHVVILSGDQSADDHTEIQVEHPNAIRLPIVSPDQNLALQIQVLARATAFVGTYGGVAQLALRLGVPSCSFYADWGGTAHAHLALSSFISKKTKVPFLVGSLQDAHLWRQIVSVTQQAQPIIASSPVPARSMLGEESMRLSGRQNCL